DIKRETLVLTEEGETYAAVGSPEIHLFMAIPPEGISREALEQRLDTSVFKIGCAQASKLKWVEYDKKKKIFSRQ
ncbi:hypothetical protein CRG98_048523, partial [Punica granatum]